MRASRPLLCACLALAGLTALSNAAAWAQEYRFTVMNGTTDALEFFYFSACGVNTWGRDRLGAKEVIAPGARRRFNMYDGIADCCRDMRATLATGASRQRLGVDVCREQEWVVR